MLKTGKFSKLLATEILIPDRFQFFGINGDLSGMNGDELPLA
jgi:hypothetical protein